MMKALKHLILFTAGGAGYYGAELLWRGSSHWTMALLGGLMFLLIGGINEFFPWQMPLLLQGAIGSVLVTAAELVTGLVLNIWLGMDVWDYSNLPLNLWGQICLPFTLLWVPVSIGAVVMDDWLRYWLWREERPHYTLFCKGKSKK